MEKGKETRECSKHKELEWKAAKKENCATYDSLELIDISVYEGDKRAPLANITNKNNPQG